MSVNRLDNKRCMYKAYSIQKKSTQYADMIWRDHDIQQTLRAPRLDYGTCVPSQKRRRQQQRRRRRIKWIIFSSLIPILAYFFVLHFSSSFYLTCVFWFHFSSLLRDFCVRFFEFNIFFSLAFLKPADVLNTEKSIVDVDDDDDNDDDYDFDEEAKKYYYNPNNSLHSHSHSQASEWACGLCVWVCVGRSPLSYFLFVDSVHFTRYRYSFYFPFYFGFFLRLKPDRRMIEHSYKFLFSLKSCFFIHRSCSDPVRALSKL